VLFQHRRELGRRRIARLVAVVGDQHALRAVLDQRGQQLIGEATDTERARDVPIPRAPERQRVNQRFAQDHFLATGDAGEIEHAAMRAGQVQVLRRAGAQLVIRRDLAAVHLHDRARRIEHGHDQRAVEVLAAVLAIHADALQTRADVGARHAVLLRQAQAERAIGVAEPERRHEVRVRQATRVQVRLRFRSRLQGLVVVVDHPRILINSVQQSDPSRYGNLVQAGTRWCG